MNVLLVTGICVRRDAISAATVSQAELIASLPGVEEVTIVAQAADRLSSVRIISASNAFDLLRLDEYAAADVVIFHWGIRYDLFEAFPLVAADRRTVVHFHNLTPAHLVAEDVRPVIEYSELQFQLVGLAPCEFWADSAHNIDRLVEWGVPRAGARVMPFPIERPASIPQRARDHSGVRYLCVGRLVPSKGVLDLVRAMPSVVERLDGQVELTIVGGTQLSASEYLDEICSTIEREGIGEFVRIRTDVDDEGLWACYDESDVLVSPSYHEGLCVPVVEGYIAGCRAIGTDAGNLPFIVQPPDPIVPVAHPERLAAAMVAVGREVLAGTSRLPAGAAAVVRAHSVAAIRDQLADALMNSVDRGAC